MESHQTPVTHLAGMIMIVICRSLWQNPPFKSLYGARAGLKLEILLPQPPEFWNTSMPNVILAHTF